MRQAVTHIRESQWIDVHPVGENLTNATCIPRSVCKWPSIIHISRDLHIAIFHESSTALDRYYYSREKVILTPPLSPAEWPMRPGLVSLLTQSLKLKPSIYWRHATRLTGPISPAYDQYVQYLLTRVNPSVFNRHRRGLQPWSCRLATSHSLTFPTDGPPLFT
jgi:hypothetical protein